ncbi:hypothetical protein A2U01_0076237, partial [Trifolium medium]|nr:hypothetical protein [Trifolium medium]
VRRWWGGRPRRTTTACSYILSLDNLYEREEKGLGGRGKLKGSGSTS